MAFTMEEVKEFKDLGPKKSFWRGLLILLVTIIVGLLAAVLSGILVAVSGTAQLSGVQIVFDPQITLAYVIVGYFVGYFNELSKKAQGNLFLLALLLSFTVNFIQGTLLLVILPPVLKKLRLI